MAGKTQTRSGDPRKKAAAKAAAAQPTQLAPTSADEWVSKTVGGDDEDIMLPSGNVARVRRVGPEAFLTQGLMPDTITPIVEKAIESKKGLKPKQQAELVEDPEKLGALMEMLDRTLCYAVVQPTVVMPPSCVECDELNSTSTPQHKDQDRDDYHEFQPYERVPGVLYADRVDLEDKMFVMNFVVGGTRDLAQFRREFGAGMAGLAAVSGSEG